MYFTVPFYFSDEYINFLVTLNNKNTKYKIKRVYNSLNYNCPSSSKYECDKLSFNRTNSFEELSSFNQILQKENIDFVYAMNSVAPISNGTFQNMIPQIEEFLNKLLSIGINKLLISSQMLADYIKSIYSDINIIISPMMQTDSIKKAQILNNEFRPVCIAPSTDLNKDFNFIESFKSLLPNTELELMANEGCLFCCPIKNFCYSFMGIENKEIVFPKKMCRNLIEKDIYNVIAKNKIIYPWELADYEKAGVDYIKLVGRNNPINSTMEQIETYAIGSTSSEEIQKKSLSSITSFFNDYIDIPLDTLKEFLPSIEFFLGERPKCRSICDLDCTSCSELADNLKAKIQAKEAI